MFGSQFKNFSILNTWVQPKVLDFYHLQRSRNLGKIEW